MTVKQKYKRNIKSRKTILISVAIALIVVLVGWYVWQRSDKNSSKAINSFESCTAAGNAIRETYPEQCSANGKTYSNPKQSVQNPRTTISQGIKGTITLRSGDCMPKFDTAPTSCSVKIYTTPSEVIIKKPKNLPNKVEKVVVKKLDIVNGVFETELQPGLYNMYVMYQGKEYCSTFGSQAGEDCEFTVEAGKITSYTLQINAATD